MSIINSSSPIEKEMSSMKKFLSGTAKKMEKVDACVSMNNLINSNVNYVKNQKSYLMKIKHAYEKSSSSARLLNEDINNYTMNATAEQNKLKDKIESLLLHLKEILLNSTIQQNNFILNTNEFYQKFEEMLKLWKQHSTSLIIDFHSFMEGISDNCFSLRNNLCSELVSLNFTEGAIIEIIKKNKTETLHMITSCSTKIHMSVENSIKLLYEVLCLLEISQGKIKEQLKKLESAICCHSNERMKFLSSTNSTMALMHQYFNAQLNSSSEINSDIFSHHQELKLSVNQEFMKIKEALNSIKKLFCTQQKFVIDKWQKRQTYLSSVKEIGGVSESLQQCTEEHPILLDKLRQQCVSSIDELYSILSDQTLTVDNLGSQLKNMFNEIECSIKDCSEENKKIISQQENDIRDGLEIQNKTIIKCINTTRSLVEGFIQCITGGLQNTRNSFFNVKNLKKNNDANHILELKDNLNGYIKKYGNILELSELTLQQLPETVPKQTENLEESLEFNHEELLSSTPSSYQERHKNFINDKTKFLNRLRKIASIQVNPGCQANLSLDQESILNATILSLPNMSTRTKVEIHTNRSLMHRKVGK
ncbi:hypothetical protein AVEN_63169-1 [Araneus ventricosus]|uniref:Uncharacterized protein n=1 Tax=Araneus ventricosus TaxID=182803 RepID=A0A4Y2B3G7_ARAVE|nr:hypothetical protein AVEN_63169-1 [Araneus ventricosus]